MKLMFAGVLKARSAFYIREKILKRGDRFFESILTTLQRKEPGTLNARFIRITPGTFPCHYTFGACILFVFGIIRDLNF